MVNLPDNFKPGAFPDRPDDRDFKYEDVVFGSPVIDWEKGYDVEKELGFLLKREDQNGSSSCVGQAFSKYAEVLNTVEEKQSTDLSAKSIYEQIFLPGGGAYLRDAASVLVKYGVAAENLVPSYENGNPPSEAYMTQQTINDSIRKEMEKYQAKEYRNIGTANSDLIAHAIMNNWGAVTGVTGDNVGWREWHVKPPSTSNTWGHAIYLLAFGLDSVGKWVEFLNSWSNNWGKNGRGRIYIDEYNLANNAFGIWTLVDKPNKIIDHALLGSLEGKYIMRTQALGQVYKIENGKVIFFDSNKQPDKHIPLVDEVIKNILIKEGRLVAITEENFNKIN